jgi:membrane protease YdiL (CAAX protease family)
MAFGAAYFLSGSLIPGILAHYLNNARGFYQLLDEAALER